MWKGTGVWGTRVRPGGLAAWLLRDLHLSPCIGCALATGASARRNQGPLPPPTFLTRPSFGGRTHRSWAPPTLSHREYF